MRPNVDITSPQVELQMLRIRKNKVPLEAGEDLEEVIIASTSIDEVYLIEFVRHYMIGLENYYMLQHSRSRRRSNERSGSSSTV
jgi:chemotaxis protein CheY-P-specific phosphatase CheC